MFFLNYNFKVKRQASDIPANTTKTEKLKAVGFKSIKGEIN